ncbi:MAG: hypothetical protein ACREDU_08535, partial [Methylocella sp.]
IRLRQAAAEARAEQGDGNTPPDRAGIGEKGCHDDDPPAGQSGALAKFAAAPSQLTVFHHLEDYLNKLAEFFDKIVRETKLTVQKPFIL